LRNRLKAKKERYRAIAAKYKPEGVEAVPVQKHQAGYRAIAHLDEECDEDGNELPPKIEVPVPDTLGRLWLYLHECAHFRLNHTLIREGTNDYSRQEAEASLEVMRIFDEEGLVAPFRVLKTEFEAFFPQVLADDKYDTANVT
jgi:hypothetical protein